MPKITKDAKSDNEEKIAKKKTTTKKATGTVATKKATTSKKTTTTKKVATKPSAKTTTKSSKTTKTKKETTAKSTTSKKTTSATTRKTTKSVAKKVKTASPEEFSVMEYYDLPNQYNKTVVKLLAQTPTTLFVYWDISEDDRKKYIEQYGENFFEITKPVLIIHNTSMNYSFEVDINDFANCWYLNVNDSKCDYNIELGRRPILSIPSNNINTDYIYISSSNEIEAPNDHIVFDKNQKMVYFKNVKTNNVNSKSINFSYMRNMGKIYNIYDMYKKIYKDENIEDYDLSNPSSKGNPSSTFK